MRPLLLLFTLLLAGCVSAPNGNVAQPLSQQTSKGDKRKRAQVHADLGYAYYEAQRFSPALDEARIAIGIDSSYALAYNLLGLIYLELHENASGEEAFQRALQLAPGDPDISNSYGWFLCQTGQEQKSQTYFETALRNPLYASSGIALLNSATCALRVKDEALAIKALNSLLSIDPDNVRGIFLLAEVSFRGGRYDEARYRLAELYRRIEPTAETAWLSLRVARKLGERGDEARFMALLRQKFADSPEAEKLRQGRFE